LRAAHAAITALAASSVTICETPEDVDLDAVAAALAPLNVALRRSTVVPEPAAFLVEVRTRHGLSQRQFADRLGFDVRTLQNWEQGRNKPDAAILNLVRIFDRDPSIVADAMFEPL
jgi:DNA-binding transcriptional regulator YiaG